MHHSLLSAGGWCRPWGVSMRQRAGATGHGVHDAAKPDSTAPGDSGQSDANAMLI